MPRPRKPAIPFRYFISSPKVIRLVVMIYVRAENALEIRTIYVTLPELGSEYCIRP